MSQSEEKSTWQSQIFYALKDKETFERSKEPRPQGGALNKKVKLYASLHSS
jgi:hypothetical protein